MSNLPWKKMTPEEIKTRDKALLVLSPLVIMLIVARFGDWNKIISSLLLGFGCSTSSEPVIGFGRRIAQKTFSARSENFNQGCL